MSWETPKTNWSAADGVRAADFNRIEGNILELYNGFGRSIIEVYVATTGSDETGDGSYASPYATVSKALSKVPKHVNGQTAVIRIAGGTYNEAVHIAGYTMPLTLSGIGSGTVTLGNLVVEDCTVMISEMYTFIVNGSLTIRNAGTLISNTDTYVHGGVTVYNCSSATFGSLYAYGSYAVSVYNVSSLYASALDGAGTTYGLYVLAGGIVTYDYSYLTGPVRTGGGGRIYTGTQSNSPLLPSSLE